MIPMDEILFVLTREDAQMMARERIGRELTNEEMHAVEKGLSAGLDGWHEIMAIAIRGVTGEG